MAFELNKILYCNSLKMMKTAMIMMYVVKAGRGRVAEWEKYPTLVGEVQNTFGWAGRREYILASCASHPDPMGLDVTDDKPIINVCSATIHSSA